MRFAGGIGRTRFTLNEMLSVVACATLLAGMLLEILQDTVRQSAQMNCGNQLRQVGQLFNAYREDFHRYPEFLPPAGLGDYTSWSDLYSSTDPSGTNFCPLQRTTTSKVKMALGDQTGDPRVPRLFTTLFNLDVEVLCCPSQGTSPFWKDIGPYYYNTTNPFNSSPLELWRARAKRDDQQPLAGCQNPEYLLLNADRGWRHGDRSLLGGINQHLMPDGSLQILTAPAAWTTR